MRGRCNPHCDNWTIIIVIAAVLIFGSQFFSTIGNYTPTGGTAHWHIEGKWAYVWFTGNWDITIPEQSRIMLEIDESRGLHIFADRN